MPTSQAFNDSKNQPSVDRAEMIDFDPDLSKKAPTDGILELVTRDVRKLVVERTEKAPGQPETKIVLNVDVVPDKIGHPIHHAVIKFHPVPGGSSNFSKLKERLALLARWHATAQMEDCS